MFGLKLTNVGTFLPLKVVGRGRESQLHVSENLNFVWGPI